MPQMGGLGSFERLKSDAFSVKSITSDGPTPFSPGILDANGWEETHIIQAPLSSERFTGNMVKAMQKKRTLGVISRYVIVARKRAV